MISSATCTRSILISEGLLTINRMMKNLSNGCVIRNVKRLLTQRNRHGNFLYTAPQFMGKCSTRQFHFDSYFRMFYDNLVINSLWKYHVFDSFPSHVITLQTGRVPSPHVCSVTCGHVTWSQLNHLLDNRAKLVHVWLSQISIEFQWKSFLCMKHSSRWRWSSSIVLITTLKPTINTS